MQSDKPKEKDFVDFMTVLGAEGAGEAQSQPNQKEARRQRLEQNFEPLIDSQVHMDVVGENMTITVNKEGDTIKSLDIECHCGRKSRLIFDYE